MNAIANNAVTLDRQGGVIVASVNNPPVNALSHAVRAGLVGAIDALEGDPSAQALVICCEGRTFIAGADLREFGAPMKSPLLGEVIARLDACAKPVIAAMHGTALGGGFEIALACSYRIAVRDARFGLPEVKLGLLPGSGGIVRLPRLIGVEAALAMISEGNQIGAQEALDKGLLDQIADGDLKAASIAFARQIVDSAKGVRRTSELPVPSFDPAHLSAKRTELARKFKGMNAPQIAVDLIEMMTTTPFAEAAEKEYAACKALIASPQSRALRHLFSAEREALKIEGIPADIAPRPVNHVAVVGPGTMGRGITTCFLMADLPVILVGRSDASLSKAQIAIAAMLDGNVKRGAISQAERDRKLAMLMLSTDYNGLGAVDLVVEAVSENIDTKKQVFRALEEALRPDAIIATNTSFLDIEELASSVSRPENVVGMHFFNPANIMKLLENVRGSRSAPDALATITALGKRLGKLPVMVGRSEGFVANRMLSKRTREAQFLLEDGATPWQVDKVLTGFGFPIGPFALADLAGMDIMAAARAARFARMTPREQRCNIVDKLVAAGRLGQKSGAGYYRYDAEGKRSPDPQVEQILADHGAEAGIVQRQITDEEILERCLYAMVNEAARILEEGAAARPGDIDVIWANGFGFPRHLGGPMFYAQEAGLPHVLEALEKYADMVGEDYFKPAALITRLVSEGRGFYG